VDYSPITLLLWLSLGPVLLFPHHFPHPFVLGCLGILLAPFAGRRLRSGRFTRDTPANGPLVLLLLLLPVTLWVTPLPWSLTWPKLTTLAWSIAGFFTVVNAIDAPSVQGRAGRRPLSRLAWLTILYLALGLALAAVGLLGLNVPDKLFDARLPRWIGGIPPIGDGYHPNEVGGMLTLFTPLAVSLWLGSRRWAGGASGRIAWLILLFLCLFFTAVLALTQSRSALAGVAVGVFFILLVGGRGSRLLLAVVVIIAIAVVAALGATPVAERLVYAGAAAPASVLEPRLRIWQQAYYGIVDFPLTGMGLGVAGRLLPVLYPRASAAPVLDDAHNLLLQTALDFGIPGLFAFIAILVLALAQAGALLRAGPATAHRRYWAAGLLASLLAHLVYSLTDAVSLGARPGFALWFLLGLMMATAAGRPATIRPAPARRTALAAVAIVLAAVAVWHAAPANDAAIVTARALLARSVPLAEAEARVAQLAPARCRLFWHDGLLWQAMGREAERDRAWASSLDCSAAFVPFMAALAPDNRPLAHSAVQKQPGSAAAIFWLAQITSAESPSTAVALYRQGLALDPGDGRRWKILGDLLVEAEPAAAIEAYLQSCYHGDPGANGCWRAGQTAEQQGDRAAAIGYYRLSKWPPARARAAQLQQELP